MKTWKLLLMMLIGALAFAAVACGGDDDDDAGGENGDGNGGSDAPAIRLGFSAWPGWFPWQVAEEAGIFDEVGVNVDLVWFDGYLDSINAFAAGQLDGNSQTLSDTIASVAAGSDQVIVLVNDNSTGNDQVIVREGIDSIEDLAGTNIGLEAGVVDHYLLLLGLQSAGVDPADVEVSNLLTDAAAAAFAAGQLDGVAVFAPFTSMALQREGSKVLFTSADFPGAIPDHLAVSRSLVEERPEDVQKLIEAWFLTIEYIENNREEALETMAERAGVTVEDYESYDAGTTIFSVEENVEAFQPGDDFTSLRFAAADIAVFLEETGLVEPGQDLDLDAIFDSQFVDAFANAGD